MTSDRITERNRANAQKSTGPRSARGKAVVAGNARRHGATARLDPGSVATWLAIILDRPEITPDNLLPGEEEGYRALALAEAELRVVATETALWEFEAGLAEPDDVVEDLRDMGQLMMEDLIQYGGKMREIRSSLSLLKRIARVEAEETLPGGKRHRLLQRYVREARARRKKAFAAWVAAREEAHVAV